MSNIYPVADGGAPGRKATWGVQDDCLTPNAQSIAVAKALSGPGTRQGTASPMPESAKSGAFTPDESVQRYSGNPRDDRG